MPKAATKVKADKPLQKAMTQDPATMTAEEKAKLREQLIELKTELLKKEQEAMDADPFWYYQPSDGTVTEEGIALLKELLKPEDIPQQFTCQIDAHKSTASIRGVSGGNRSGKSVVGTLEDFIQATGEVPESMVAWYPKEKIPTKFPQRLRVIGIDVKQMMNTVLPHYKQWCPREYLYKGSWDESFSSKQNTLFLQKKGREIASIEFMTNAQDVDSFQGPTLDKLTIDEECLHRIFKENLLRFATAERLNIQMNFTPTKGITWTADLFQNEKIGGEKLAGAESVELFQLSSITNTRVKTSILREIVNQLDTYEEIKMRLLGEFVSLSGLVYGRLFDKALHVIEPFPITPDHYIVRGLDPHLVKPTTVIEAAIDREDNIYIVGSYQKDVDTQEVKDDLAARATERKYRLGWSACDKSSNSTVRVFGDRNIYLELSRGKNAIPALFLSEKFTGSINAGVDEIKKRLKVNERTKKPTFFIFNTTENKTLINAMKTLERDTYANEDDKGMKDKIKEGKHDTHAAMRYIFQRPIRWMPQQESVPAYEPDNAAIGY